MIDKSRLPRVAKAQMNTVHEEELERINTLLTALKESDDNAITKAVESLLAHMKEHFDYEEGMLKNRGFGMFEIHRSDHTRIMNETRMAYMNWRNFRDREALREFIKEDFMEWLDFHIQAMDSVAADFLVQQERAR
ncbi:MAG: hemerythrin family protein [Epsilonproteobacteria bacterium]|nr:hemerythrin family protein [Campylobacterota bacterium]